MSESVLYILCSMADLSPAITHLVEQLESRLLPLLRCYASLETLDAGCNFAFDAVSLKHSIFLSGYYRYSRHHLHIAFLARHPRLPAMCDTFESMLEREGRSLFSGEDDKVRNCIEYLRGHPQGLR